MYQLISTTYVAQININTLFATVIQLKYTIFVSIISQSESGSNSLVKRLWEWEDPLIVSLNPY